MRLDAITFDIDDTLWDNVPVMQHLESEMVRWLEREIGQPLQIEKAEMQQRRMQLGAELMSTPRRGDVTYVREQVTWQVLKEHGLSESAADQLARRATEKMLELRHLVTPYPEVDALLAELAPHYRLAVITNGNVDVNQLPLARHFDVIFKAGELGMPKPDHGIFLHTLQALGDIAPEHAMHVGDSWTSDVEPAAALGMQAVWIDLFNEPRPLTERIHRIEHVRDLPQVLHSLGCA
ncbi:HAD family hydrolase [Carnimonas nigrificans]|uniref:HAD family hydrolase n=1 Tax=Carnimonas nigrificans TaxID=64323 RepID=UPI0004726379|nr:HAD family hydrolase [Carnimonas nigrificans]